MAESRRLESLITYEQYQQLCDVLYREAELLDRREFRAWLELLDPELRYVMPVRVTPGSSDASSFSPAGRFFDETRSSLEMRVARLETGFAFAEEPPARTRRLVGNIRAERQEGAHYRVGSNLLLWVAYGDAAEALVLAAHREDEWVAEGEAWRLRRRAIYPDWTTLPLRNLTLFF